MCAIRDRGLLDVGFLATLPNNRDNLSPFYKPILERLISAFHSEALTPMKQGGHAVAKGVFRGQARVSDLIVDDDLVTLLDKPHSPPLWIANPPQIHQREDNFLSILNISEWKSEDLVGSLSVESEKISKWLSEKPYEWFQQLYGLLSSVLDSDNDLMRRKIEDLKIIRLSDGTFSKGKESFFPDADGIHDQTFPRVAKEIYSSGENEREQRESRKFLKDIGVRKVGEGERIEVILKHRYSKGSIKPQIQDMKRFMEFVEKNPEEIDLFKNFHIFQLENRKWGKPSMVFLDFPYLYTGLKAYYDALGDDSHRKWALSPKYKEKYKEAGIEPKKFEEFAKKIGVQMKLEAHKKKISRDHPEKSKLKDNRQWSTDHGIDEDYDISEFDILLDTSNLITSKLIRSKLVWNTMNKQPDYILEASYRSNSRYDTSTANSSLVCKLRKHDWIPQKQDAQEKFSFVKPSEAVQQFLPSGFSFDRGMQWLKAIEFGKAERNRKEKENIEQEQATSEYKRKREAAETLGFPSVEGAEEAVMMIKKYPQKYLELISKLKTEAQKEVFLVTPSPNLKRRRDKVSQDYSDSPLKKYEPHNRFIRVTKDIATTRTWLRNTYTDLSNQMICQTCHNEMPFKKRDGEYYFEAVEALSRKYFSNEYEAQFLALCPLCAAKYKEFVKHDEDAMQELYRALKKSNSLEVPLRLGDWKTNLWFFETHRQDLKTILNLNK